MDHPVHVVRCVDDADLAGIEVVHRVSLEVAQRIFRTLAEFWWKFVLREGKEDGGHGWDVVRRGIELPPDTRRSPTAQGRPSTGPNASSGGQYCSGTNSCSQAPIPGTSGSRSTSSGDVVGIRAGVDEGDDPAVGGAEEDVGTGHVGNVEQGVQILDGVSRRQWSRCRVAAPDVGAVVDAEAVVVAQQARDLAGGSMTAAPPAPWK